MDVFAPGVNITSAWGSDDTATNTISGTAMATPHVAGVVATYLQTNPTATPALVASTITTSATQGVRQEPRVRLAEPPAVLGLHGVPAAASAPAPPPPEPGTFTLTASGQTFFATVKPVTLTWTGATSQYMSLFRDGGNIGAAANTGSFTDVVMTSGGTIVYKICEYNTTVCSNTASVMF